jgi:AraC family transcriptional regulator
MPALGTKPKHMQNASKLFIKGMVCQRCIIVLKKELEASGMVVVKAELGEVTVLTSKQAIEMGRIAEKLAPLGFQLLEDKKVKTVDAIRELVKEVYSGNFDFPYNFRFSDLLSQRLEKEYDSLSALFSLLEHKTLERYIIDFRIERIKEFLVYTSSTLSDIAFRLNFSSVAHLSRQFKQYTGLNPSHFKEIKKARVQAGFSDN